MRLLPVRRLCGTIPRRVRSAVAAIAPRPSLLALCVPLVLVACTGVRANSHYRYPRDVAYGRPSTCPDVRLPPLRDGNVSPDAARCSYADANGARVTHLAGKVLAEGGPGSPGISVPEVAVTVHAIKGPVFDVQAPGPAIAHATTDTQGNYSLRGVFVAGDYAIVVREPGGERITERVIRVEPEQIGSIKDLRVMVPIDPRLKAEAAEPPPPESDPRLHHSPPVADAKAPPPTTTAPPSTTTATPPPKPPATTKPPPSPGLRMRPPPPTP